MDVQIFSAKRINDPLLIGSGIPRREVNTWSKYAKYVQRGSGAKAGSCWHECKASNVDVCRFCVFFSANESSKEFASKKNSCRVGRISMFLLNAPYKVA